MERKLVKQGKHSLTLALPKKWIKENNLVQGDEITLKVSYNNIIISSNKDPSKSLQTIKINFHDIKPLFKRYICSAGRLGIDSIEVIFEDSTNIEKVIQVINNDLFGFEVISQRNSRLIIRNMSYLRIDQFVPSLIRNSEVTLEIFSHIRKNFLNKDFLNIDPILNLETTNNKLMSFCKNIIFSEDNFNKKESIIWYSIIEYLEKIADELRYLSVNLKQNPNSRINPKTIKFFNSIENLYFIFSKHLINPDSANAIKRFSKYKNLNLDSMTNIKITDNINSSVLHYLISISQYLVSCFFLTVKLSILKELKY